MPVDPVCGMEIEESEIADTADYRGRIYYFCSTGCRQTFEENPAEFMEYRDLGDLERLAMTDIEEPETEASGRR